LVRVLLGTGLRQEGRTVWLARSGDEALELYRRHANEIGLVLLAVRLPGLDGPQTLAALRRIDPGVRCCFLSGPLSEFTDAELLKLGATAVLHKTLAPAQIKLMLWQLLGDSPTGCFPGEGGLTAALRWLWRLEEFVPTESSLDGRLPAP
jgi:DNA-binding response OmpR family regulator